LLPILFAAGRAEVFDDKAAMFHHFWQAWSWQNFTGFTACQSLEVSAY